MHPELAHFFVLENALADCEHLLLHFRGPVCDLSVRPVTAVTARLRELLAGQGVPLPPAIRAASDPYALLRFILAACPGLAARAEAEICQQEILAAAAARPSPGLRTLLDGPASVSIIGDVCPAAIKGYLARLYRHHMDRVRLIIGRLGADPALLEPTPIPILQAAQLLGVPPAACAVVASTPDSIRAARQGPAHRRRRRRQHRQHDRARRRRLQHRTAPAVRPSPPRRTIIPRGRNRGLGRPLPGTCHVR
jgi:beta-phosphoglucomutase-like phosphatase (HAD superfamily)